MEQIGRLAMRVEGDWWVAYMATEHTMKDAVELGRLRMTLAKLPGIKEATLEFYQRVYNAAVSNATGLKLEWSNDPQPAPEHERAGRA